MRLEMGRRQQLPSSMLVVGVNLNLAHPWQINNNRRLRDTPIKSHKRQQFEGNSTNHPPSPTPVKPTPETTNAEASGTHPQPPPGPPAPHQSSLAGGWKMKSQGKRVSLVDARDTLAVAAGAEEVSQVLPPSSLSVTGGGGGTTKKKHPRHISQLNSSENCSTITSTGTRTSTSMEEAEEHEQQQRKPKARKRNVNSTSSQRQRPQSRKRGKGGEKSSSVARNKTLHLFRKLIQRQILQIPRLNLLPTNRSSSYQRRSLS